MNESVIVHVFYTVPSPVGNIGGIKVIKMRPFETIREAFIRYGGGEGTGAAIVGSVIGGAVEWNTGVVIKTN